MEGETRRAKLCQMLTCHREKTKEKEEPEGSKQRDHPSSLLTSSFFTIPFTCMADISSGASELGGEGG